MKILFCTDGSKISYVALDNFIKWVKNYKIDILSVADLGVVPDTTSLEASEFAMYCTKSVDKIIEHTIELLQEKEIPLGEKHKMCGSVVDSIMEIEEEFGDYDVILLGSNGKRGIQKWLGSVSNEIAAISKTSVYIAKGANSSNKVMFTVDNTQESLESVKKGIHLLDLSDKEIHLVTVFEMPDYVFLEGKFDTNWVIDVEKQQQKAAMATLNQFEEILAGYNVVAKSVLKGTPAIEIVKYSMHEGIDLVVTGMRKRKYLPRFILGSVSKRVIENVEADCFVVKI